MLFGRWSIAEHERFLRGLSQYGNDWKLVSEVVKTRTITQVGLSEWLKQRFAVMLRNTFLA